MNIVGAQIRLMHFTIHDKDSERVSADSASKEKGHRTGCRVEGGAVWRNKGGDVTDLEIRVK